MSNSFETIGAIIANTPPLSKMLKDAHLYRAHVHPKYPPEPFEDHFDRVNQHFGLICKKNGLDDLIDNMIADYVRSFFPKSNFEETCNFIKRLFVHTSVFHDFGKINENFQAHPKKMNNPAFQMRRDSPLKHHHSKLGAYFYVVKHFEETQDLKFLAKEEQRQMFLTILLFSYPIFKHHASGLLRPDGKGILFEPEELKWMKRYLGHYNMVPDERLTGAILEQKALEQQFFDWIYKDDKIQLGFSFFALMRLNFSLLTASDYLATGEYSYQLKLETDADWGIFSNEKRKKVVDAPRTNLEKDYNTEAYSCLEKIKRGKYEFQKPQIATEDNLNILRTEMAVKVLQALEKHSEKRLFYLEAPTGGGKTNLSMLAVAELLRADSRLTKVFYVFPFTTLITQTHKAIKETLCLNDDDIALLHSKAGFQTSEALANEEETEDGTYGNRRRDFLQNLFALYPLTLVTHVRFFDILKSNRKDDIYLMHRLANSVVVLDELQSYPPRQWDKMLFMLDQYGKYFNIRFLLMSATLPRLTEIDAVKRTSGGLPEVVDLLPEAGEYFRNPNFRSRVSFRFDLLENDKGEILLSDLATIILEKSHVRAAVSDGRVFTIVEFIFKKSATEFKSVIESLERQIQFFGEHIYVLSGTILESQRRKIIYFVKKHRKTKGMKILLITTQVVEAGVDIDMDLGFKNVSLIDSDEQLAGRVNRNVSKQNCEVYLFRKDDPNVLYKSDLRYQITRELPVAFHREILETKNFGKLYERVFSEIEKRNKSEMVENFESDYLGFLKKLDFPRIDDRFKVIDQQTISIFVPVSLPVTIENQEGENEPFFNEFELIFLKKASVISDGASQIDGVAVWALYHNVLSNPNSDFIAKKIEQKVMQGILSKFTFSLFSSPQNRERLVFFSNPEISFENYFYLSRHKEVYSVESGLDEEILKNPCPLI
jgi:CRISPR-associated endonuclease/helicase Cas3